MRLTLNGDDRQHAVLENGPVECGQDPADLVYDDGFASATDLLNEMDWRTRQCAFAACQPCRNAVLELARQEESFWLAQPRRVAVMA